MAPLSDADRAAGWIEWAGGECPVHAGTPVEFRNRGGGSDTVENSFNLIWNWYGKSAAWHIIAYRVVSKDQRAAAGNGGAEGTSTASQEAPGHERCQTAALPSETPETDAAFEDSRSTEERAARFHMLARKLEREAAALRRELQQLAHERDGILEKLIAAEQRAKDAGGGNG